MLGDDDAMSRLIWVWSWILEHGKETTFPVADYQMDVYSGSGYNDKVGERSPGGNV